MMHDKFITQNSLKDLLKDAMNISIASAYLSRLAIDDIKSVLDQLPNKGGRIFRFLLDKDFHPEPQMQQLLINMLLELPNTEVRIYRGARLFHPKIYIFESGNRMCTTIGSFNVTKGGAGANIEAGIQLSDPILQREVRTFFDQWWNDPATEVGIRDESAVYVAQRYRPGDSVIVKATREIGIVLNSAPIFDNQAKEWIYTIRVPDSARELHESEIEPVRIAIYKNETVYQNTTSDIEAWLRNYVLEKEGEQADNTIAALASTRTILLPYQFRPLMKLLHNDQQRLLIADEVGLGKTIEAGIVLKELVCRGSANSVLIIVPNSLKTKWKDELQIRFDEYFDILSAPDLVDYLEEFERSGAPNPIHGIITYDQLATKSVMRVIGRLVAPPLFDLVIIDEAHWLKNPETLRYKAASKLTKHSLALLMLTATPIQLGTADLFSMLTILLPEFSDTLDPRGFSASLTVNHRINKAIALLRKREFEYFHETIREISSTRIFRNSINTFDNYDQIITRCLEADSSLSDPDLDRVASDLYTLNVLGQFINRTLRKEVSEQFADRNVLTWEYTHSDAETKIYDAIIKACRERYNSNGRSSFATITPERRAASCISAMYDDILGWKEVENEAGSTDESEEDGDEQANSDDLKNSWSAAKHALEQLPVPESDSKLEELKEIISQYFLEAETIGDQKIMIFCVFKATIRYLKEKLSNIFLNAQIETIDGDDDILTRDAKRALFSRNDKPAILICSEVAGEGLDFQFCHTLVNYDMPWNPSKLEQRAGRIDRMGQEASVVNIVNLVNKHTIEDHIMATLFKRVKLFSNTLGPLGEIVDKYQKGFAKRLLTHERSDAAREAYERQVISNVENKLRSQAHFEEQQVEIFGAGNFFYDESGKNRTRFLGKEIELIWKAYLKEFSKRINAEDEVFSMPLDDDGKAMLFEALSHRGCLPANNRRDNHYKSLINSLSRDNKPIQYTFNQKVALKRLSVQFLNVGHPFIQGAIYKVRKDYQPNRSILTCQIDDGLLQPGHYIFALYRFSVIERGNAKTRYVEDQGYLCNVNDHVGTWEQKEGILNSLIVSAKPTKLERAPDDLKELLPVLFKATEMKANDILIDFGKLESVRRNSKKMSLTRLYNAKISKIDKDLSFIHDQKIRERRHEDIAALKSELTAKIAELELDDFRISSKCTGIIHITSMEIESAGT